MAENKEKRYVSNNAQLMAEWHWEKNVDISPSKLALGSHKKVWWKCPQQHEWQAVVKDRNSGNGCPYCSGKCPVKGKNDLQTANPDLACEWNYDINIGLIPEDVMPSSHRKVWWKCQKGHEWQATIASRNSGRGCPMCSGRNAIKGCNDLLTVNPRLAEEWNYEKNVGLSPMDVLPNSDKKIWWRCIEGHEWQARIYHRNKGVGCPQCAGQKVIIGCNDLQTVNPTLAKEWNDEKNKGLTPSCVMANSHHKVWWRCNKGHEWQAMIKHRNNGSGCPACNSERKSSFPEYMIEYYLQEHGIETIHPYTERGYELDVYIPSMKIAIEYDGYLWHKDTTKRDLEKNLKCQTDGITLYRIREGLPPLNDTSIDYIVQKNEVGLPETIKLVLSQITGSDIEINLEKDSIAIENLREHTEKEHSLLFENPKISLEWNYNKNGNLRPEYVAENSSKKVWWICQKGHEWQALISNRNKGNGCPYCAGRKILRGYNDLKTINPTLAVEWNYERNDSLLPTDVLPNSNKIVWWKCQKGHEWQARIYSRNSGRGCPYCSGKMVLKDFNSLQVTNPPLVIEWNYEKNNGLFPEHFTAHSGQKVWWKCGQGHEWQARIADRTKGTGCPQCFNEKRKTN